MNAEKIVSRRTGDKQIANLKYILGIKFRDSGYFWYDTGDACIHLKKFLYIKSFPSFNLSHSYRDSQVVIGLKSINFFLCHAQKVQELLINTWLLISIKPISCVPILILVLKTQTLPCDYILCSFAGS